MTSGTTDTADVLGCFPALPLTVFLGRGAGVESSSVSSASSTGAHLPLAVTVMLLVCMSPLLTKD